MFYLEDLEKLKCMEPDCDHTSHDKVLIINKECHPFASMQVEVNAMEGVLVVKCEECSSIVCEVAIASNSTYEQSLIGEEASRQMYGTVVNLLKHITSPKPPEDMGRLLKDTMDVVDRYRNHYGVDLPEKPKS